MIRPLGDWVVLKEKSEIRNSGILLVGISPSLFEVVACPASFGAGLEGKTVVVTKYLGEYLTYNNEKLLFVEFKDILGVIDG